MSQNGVIKINKGFDIRLAGVSANKTDIVPVSEMVALCPDDFLDTIPKPVVGPGDEVKAGDVIFFSKDRPELKFTSPVSGQVIEVRRGEKRKILEVRIKADKNTSYRNFDVAGQNREHIVNVMQEAGVWPYLRQRPYNTIADAADSPKAIFISGFDTAPLAPDLNYVLGQRTDAFKKGISILQKLGAPVHLSLKTGENGEWSKGLDGVKIHQFSGKHPAGNVGIQIHHISPVRTAKDLVWTIHPQDVCIIGDLFLSGHYKPNRIINVCGSEVQNPQYYQVLAGTALSSLLNGILSSGIIRIIRGNVLTGIETNTDKFLGYYDNQISVIPEVIAPELFGWLLPGFGKLSLSRTFFSWIAPKNNYVLNTSMNGEHRNFVVTGEYEKVLPMNLLPVHLLKAIMARDIEMMEKLGIYEIAEEDLALCEYVCTSKMPVQQIVREGLDLMRKEG
jgi:Na+-transporting NADH:ubiquinone oxidoreductase subunit A